MGGEYPQQREMSNRKTLTLLKIKAAIGEALLCREEGREMTILFCLSGHGYLDLRAYADYRSGKFSDHEYADQKVQESLAKLPQISIDQKCRFH